jgi:hypothetical protein
VDRILAAAIQAGAVSFDAGLTIEFTPGAAPSFVAGDTFSFRALQPWAVSNLKTPTVERWQWAGATANLVADLGAAYALDTAAIALHTLPAGATILIEGGTAPATYTWSEVAIWQAGAIVAGFSQTRTARYLRISVASATGGGIGWLWVGSAFATELSGDVTMRQSYKVARGEGGLYSGGRYLGRSISGEIAWAEAALSEADALGIVALLDWVKAADDEPFILVPQIERPEDALLVRVMEDEIELPDLFSYQPGATKERRLSARLPLAGVWR